MRKQILNHSFAFRLSDQQRGAIEKLADERDIAMGEALRLFLAAGIQVIENPGRHPTAMPPEDE